jgi:hypothetical protein
MMVSPVERMEQKYFVAPERMILALALLRRTCRWDEHYPQEQINSLYFDTPDLEQHRASSAGELAKSKIRVRWYGQEHDPHERVPAAEGLPGAGSVAAADILVWLELKQRRGFASTKQRHQVTVTTTALSPSAHSKGIVSPTLLLHTIAGFGYVIAQPLCPVIAVSYWRHRFVEPVTGIRVALDSHIRSTAVLPGIGRGERGLELAGAVIEVKGPSADIPVCLLPLRDLGSSWTRFSKYSSSLDAHEMRNSNREGTTCGRM